MLLALLQGVSELFPISSLGHTILLPALLGWKIDRSDPTFLAFVVVLHLGTAVALFIFYFADWVVLIRALFRSIGAGNLSADRDERVAWLLVVGTIPVGLLGLLLQEPVRKLFGSVIPVAIFLMLNAGIMFLGEYLRMRQHRNAGKSYKALPQLSWAQSTGIGIAQSLALLPGISRSGSSIVAGLLADLNHEDAAKYSFLLATPVIAAAAVLEIPILWAPGAHVVALQAILGCVLAGVAAYFSVAFLTRYFKSNDLRPFGWYCLVLGALCLILALKGVIS